MVEFIVVEDDMPYDVILGWKNFIKLYEGIIDSNNNKITLRKPNANISNVAFVDRPVEIPAFSEMIIPAKFKQRYDGQNIFISPFEPLLARTGVSIMSGVHELNKYHKESQLVNLVVANFSTQPVRLPTNTIIAKVEISDKHMNIVEFKQKDNIKKMAHCSVINKANSCANENEKQLVLSGPATSKPSVKLLSKTQTSNQTRLLK